MLDCLASLRHVLFTVVASPIRIGGEISIDRRVFKADGCYIVQVLFRYRKVIFPIFRFAVDVIIGLGSLESPRFPCVRRDNS